MPKSKLQEYI